MGLVDAVQTLIGCAWGRMVWTEDDPEPCDAQANSITVIHHEGRQVAVKLCPKHKSRVMEETTPRADQIELAFLTCEECGSAVACKLGEEPPSSCARHN